MPKSTKCKLSAAEHRERETASCWATTELLRHERFRSTIYDPVALDDGIVQGIVQAGLGAFKSSYGLTNYERRDLVNVITEPNIADADAYARLAIDLCTQKVAFLLPLEFLSRSSTRKLVQETPLVRVHAITKRLPYRNRSMAWYVWEKGSFEPVTLRFI